MEVRPPPPVDDPSGDGAPAGWTDAAPAAPVLDREQHVLPRPATRPPAECATIVDVLRWRAAQQPDDVAFTFLVDGEAEEEAVTYGELDRQARAIAALLAERCVPGDRALLLYPAGLEFVAAYFGCQYAGVIAAPLNLPRSKRHMGRVRAVIADCGARVALTASSVAGKVGAFFRDDEALPEDMLLATDGVRGGDGQAPPRVVPDDIAFLQYTSGSTGSPKGVAVTHRNLMANAEAVFGCAEAWEPDSWFYWLPQFHDMGLIGGIVQPVYTGVPGHLMSPEHFIQSPLRWLRALTRTGAAMSAGPNFAYELCLRAAQGADLTGIDLSRLRAMWNGAEPVRAQTLRRFAEVFGPYGFRPDGFLPCYGLAEATLIVSGLQRPAESTVLALSAAALREGRVELVADGREAGAVEAVSCGTPTSCEVMIVDPDSDLGCPPNAVGEIWVSGANVGSGYWGRPEATAETFGARLAATGAGPYLRTGDLGFLHGGELFIVGRCKDTIVTRGRNLYPHDLEAVAERVLPFARPNGVAAVPVETADGEGVGVVAEVDRPLAHALRSPEAERARAEADELARRLAAEVAAELGVAVHTLALVMPGAFPRTTSGKVQRHACRQGLADGSLDTLHVWTRPTAGPAEAARAPVAGPAEVEGRLHDFLVRWLARRYGYAGGPIAIDHPFTALGIDSIDAAELVLELGEAFGRHVSIESFYDHSTIREYAEYLALAAPARLPHTRHRTTAEPERPRSEPEVRRERTVADAPGTAGSAGVDRHLARYRLKNRRFTRLRKDGDYFFGSEITSQTAATVTVGGKRMVMFGSYSYLGLVGHPRLVRAATNAVEMFGTGHHGVRLLGGTTALHLDLERRLAELLVAEDAIVFSSGYVTNLATIGALVGDGECVVGDEWNHASIVDGCRFSGAEFTTYRHNDLAALEERLRATEGRPTLVVTDSVFSMDGDVAPLPAIVELCRRYGAMLMVDEAHSLGVLGRTGRGVQEHFGLPPDAIDVKMATLSKAIPSTGGVVAGRREIVEHLRHHARGYMFSGALPIGDVASARAALDVLDAEPERLDRLWHNARRYTEGVQTLGFDTLGTTTPIIPLLCPDERAAFAMTRRCREEGLFVVPVVYPAVPMTTPRLRTCVMASHTDEHVDFALDVLGRAGREAGVIQ